ncbi:MAG: 2-amino-4-hydroxy-6-hydroxymethyldihydropteridine diphosphokinase [Dysgonamonadaceae bacterium]|jgi:2-amino-4-hydroxy-6-hydroxymethyldihydropteridine diphosphokinase|nr:2-amino-4-hydroxy-6-hydroxymethyldihydropteridine diphosphokinase [Dysgonamonadaceae bacterium]
MIIHLLLGSNLGNRIENLQKARQLITEQAGRLVAVSSEYETEPWGFSSNNMFLNQAIAVETDLLPDKVLTVTESIEKQAGRKEKTCLHTYKDRIIDIDLLLADNIVLNTDKLTVPHPFMHDRLFVMQPLCEIAPDVLHPVFKKTIRQLLEDLLKSINQ